jgi:hypothetical protein
VAATRLRLTRDSVAAGDDADAPHARDLAFPAELRTPEQLQALVAEAASHYLPGVAGPACWVTWSRLPLAVFASRWPAPRPLWLTDADLERLDRRGDALHLHFVYLAMVDPDVALEVVRLSMSALRES